jgi:hypothetical protein
VQHVVMVSPDDTATKSTAHPHVVLNQKQRPCMLQHARSAVKLLSQSSRQHYTVQTPVRQLLCGKIVMFVENHFKLK